MTTALPPHLYRRGLPRLGGDKLSVMTITLLIGSVMFLPMLAFVDLPRPESWVLLGISISIHTVYHLVLPLAYRHGDLSQVYPIARSLGGRSFPTDPAVAIGSKNSSGWW